MEGDKMPTVSTTPFKWDISHDPLLPCSLKPFEVSRLYVRGRNYRDTVLTGRGRHPPPPTHPPAPPVFFPPLSGQRGEQSLQNRDTGTNDSSNTWTCAVRRDSLAPRKSQCVVVNGILYWTAVDSMSTSTSPGGLPFWHGLILPLAQKYFLLEGVVRVLGLHLLPSCLQCYDYGQSLWRALCVALTVAGTECTKCTAARLSVATGKCEMFYVCFNMIFTFFMILC